MANTGYKHWYNLEKFYTADGTSSGEKKKNVDTDPDYVAPVYDTTYCPIPDDEAPAFTTALSITSMETYAANLSWASSDNVGVSEHVVYWRRTDQSTWHSAVIAGSATSYEVTNLFSGYEYDFYVVAKDSAGNSTSSGIVVGTTKTLTISPTSKSVTKDSGSFNISVSSDTTWSVSDNVAWVSISGASGSGNDSFAVAYEANTGDQRSATVTVSASDGGKSVTCNVTQAAGNVVYSQSLGYDSSLDTNSCSASKSTYYTDDSSFILSDKLYTDSSGTTLAPAGYYSDGTDWRHWDGSFFGTSGQCGGGLEPV